MLLAALGRRPLSLRRWRWQAGIGGGGSFVDSSEAGRASWEATFNICWFGVYYMSRAFLAMLMASDEGCLVNTSSIKCGPLSTSREL